mgnify:CR=1 FL=1
MDIVIGAGVSGLSYSCFTKNSYLVIEKEQEIGGYCRTIKQDGFVWDYSGHFFHFQNPDIKAFVLENINIDELCEVKKNTQILYKDRYIDFPFQKNIHQLEKEEFIDCLYDLFVARDDEMKNSFKNMVYSNFGKGIAEKFLIPYNQKLYACDLDRLDSRAMGRFFPKASREEIILNFRDSKNISYNSSFIYPKGGAIEYVNSLVKRLDSSKISLKEEVTNIDILHKETINNIQYYGEHYTNTAEYGSTRQIYFTMHLLARMSIWMQILPYQMSDILSKDPFDYKGIEWIKKLMYLFHKYPNIDQMNDHFMEIAKIVAENFSLSREEIWEKVS